MVEMRAVNGHLMTYNVIGQYEDGSPRVSQWDASHSDNCHCTDEDA